MEEYKQSLIIGNANIITMGENNRYIEDGGILVENGIIKKVGMTKVLQDEHPDVPFFDMKGMLMMPGNIIAHTHMYSSFARGMSLSGEPASNFVEILERLWWRLDKTLTNEDNYFSALAYLIQCIKSGTTTIIDHHASPKAIDASLDIIAKAVFESGIRASLCYEVTDRGGRDEAEAGINENVRFIKKCNEYPTSYIRAAFGIHASFTVSDETLAKCIEEAKKYNAVIHLHVEEDMADRADSEEKYGVPVLARLKKLGATDVPIIACHCVHMADSEYEILKNNNIVVVHNPSSNMNNAVGVANVLKMLDEGITVGLGTDGMTADFFQEIKILPLLHKVYTRNPRTFPFNRIYETIYINNPKVASLFWKDVKVGAIEENHYADVVALDYQSPTPVTAENILGHIIFGINSSMINTVIVNGQLLMRDHQLIHLDETRIMAKCRQAAAKLWERI